MRTVRGDERKLDRQIVEYVGEIESRRLYAEIGYPSVIEWRQLAKFQSAIRSEEKRSGERVSIAIRTETIAETENKTMRETERIVAKHFPEAVKVGGVQITLTDEQLLELERVRELKSHSNWIEVSNSDGSHSAGRARGEK